MTPAMTIALPAVLDTAAAGPLRLTLRQAWDRAEPLLLDGSGVERVGQACLQVLAAGQGAAAADGTTFRIANPSPGLVEMVTLAGLDTLLLA